MQSLRFIGAMFVTGVCLLLARHIAPHQINSIAVYCAWSFAGLGLLAAVIGIIKG